MDILYFDSWASVFRTVVLTVLAYVALVLILRVTGKRTLTKMNTFDFIVTIALGSSFATVVLNNNVALFDGIVLFFLLIILQFCITWLSVRIRRFKHFVTGTPTLLLYKGEIHEETLRKERIMKEELFVVARSKGISDLKEVDAPGSTSRTWINPISAPFISASSIRDPSISSLSEYIYYIPHARP